MPPPNHIFYVDSATASANVPAEVVEAGAFISAVPVQDAPASFPYKTPSTPKAAALATLVPKAHSTEPSGLH